MAAVCYCWLPTSATKQDNICMRQRPSMSLKGWTNLLSIGKAREGPALASSRGLSIMKSPKRVCWMCLGFSRTQTTHRCVTPSSSSVSCNSPPSIHAFTYIYSCIIITCMVRSKRCSLLTGKVPLAQISDSPDLSLNIQVPLQACSYPLEFIVDYPGDSWLESMVMQPPLQGTSSKFNELMWYVDV